MVVRNEGQIDFRIMEVAQLLEQMPIIFCVRDDETLIQPEVFYSNSLDCIYLRIGVDLCYRSGFSIDDLPSIENSEFSIEGENFPLNESFIELISRLVEIDYVCISDFDLGIRIPSEFLQLSLTDRGIKIEIIECPSDDPRLIVINPHHQMAVNIFGIYGASIASQAMVENSEEPNWESEGF